MTPGLEPRAGRGRPPQTLNLTADEGETALHDPGTGDPRMIGSLPPSGRPAFAALALLAARPAPARDPEAPAATHARVARTSGAEVAAAPTAFAGRTATGW